MRTDVTGCCTEGFSLGSQSTASSKIAGNVLEETVSERWEERPTLGRLTRHSECFHSPAPNSEKDPNPPLKQYSFSKGSSRTFGIWGNRIWVSILRTKRTVFQFCELLYFNIPPRFPSRPGAPRFLVSSPRAGQDSSRGMLRDCEDLDQVNSFVTICHQLQITTTSTTASTIHWALTLSCGKNSTCVMACNPPPERHIAYKGHHHVLQSYSRNTSNQVTLHLAIFSCSDLKCLHYKNLCNEDDPILQLMPSRVYEIWFYILQIFNKWCFSEMTYQVAKL